MQIDLAEVPPAVRDHLGLPATGLLTLFHDHDGLWPKGAERSKAARLVIFDGPVSPANVPEDLDAAHRLPRAPSIWRPAG